MVFDLAPVGLCISRQRTIERCNAAFAAMFGHDAAQLAGQSLVLLYPSPEEFEHIGRLGLPAMLETGLYSDERIMRRRDGSLFWCHVAGRSLDRRAPYACAVWMFEDLSARRPVSAALTAREREIAQQLVTGQTSKQIARALGISHRTVEAHRARLMHKLAVSTPGEMIARLVGRS
jgi:PAS domain S-box-containing protein